MVKKCIVIIIGVIFSFSSAVFYCPDKSRAADLGISNPSISADMVTTWDCIYFGSYWQRDTNGDGKADQNDKKEKIRWRVLSVDGQGAFLMSNQCLDSQPFHSTWDDVTWEKADLRAWLNNTFVKAAFTQEEQKIITSAKVNGGKNFFGGEGGVYEVNDNIYLLSVSEAENPAYGFCEGYASADRARIVGNTDFARAQSDNAAVKEADWWLRSSGAAAYGAAFVNGAGLVSGYGSDNREKMGICPVIHISLANTDLWSVAEKVKSTDIQEESKQDSEKKDPIASIPASDTPSKQNNPVKDQTQSSSAKNNSDADNKKEKQTAPAKVNSVTLKNTKRKTVTVRWKKVRNANGYELQYGRNKNFRKSKTKKKRMTRTTFSIKKLKRKKVYYVRIRAYKLNGKKKIYGKWSKTKKIKIKK